MLNFDEARFLTILRGALELAEPLREVAREFVAGDGENVFFLGAGGAGVLMLPAAQLLQRSTRLPVRLEHAAEVTLTEPVALGRGSLVVIPSLSGTTPESISVLEAGRARGARVLALTGHAGTPVADNADVNLTTFAEDDTSSETFYLQSLLLALALLDARGELDGYDEIAAELALLPDLLVGVKQEFEERAATLAEVYRDEPYHVITGAGSTWAEAWYYGTCILEEMQWIRTRPIHAADFFHGTLELVEEGVSVLILQGEDAARPLTERVEAFAPTVTSKVEVLDAAEFALPGISPHTRALISHIVLATALERLSAHLEILREHPLTTRRYYRRVAY